MHFHGRALTVISGSRRILVRGFFQPVTGKVERLALKQMGPLGQESRDRFVYIGPAAVELEQGQKLEAEGKRYHVRSAQLVWYDGVPLYCWAMCVEEGCEDAWGFNG